MRDFDKALRLVVKEIRDPTAEGVQLSMEKTSELFRVIRSRVIDENIHCPKHVEKHKQHEESKQPPRQSEFCFRENLSAIAQHLVKPDSSETVFVEYLNLAIVADFFDSAHSWLIDCSAESENCDRIFEPNFVWQKEKFEVYKMFFRTAWDHRVKQNTAHLIFAQLRDIYEPGSTATIIKPWLIKADVHKFYSDVFCDHVLKVIAEDPDRALDSWYEYDRQTD